MRRDWTGNAFHADDRPRLQEKICPVGFFRDTRLTPGGDAHQNSINLARCILNERKTVLVVVPAGRPAVVAPERNSGSAPSQLTSVWVLGSVVPSGETFALATGNKAKPNVPVLLLRSCAGAGAVMVSSSHPGPEDYFGMVEPMVDYGVPIRDYRSASAFTPLLTSQALSDRENHFGAPYLIVVETGKDPEKVHAKFLGSDDSVEIAVISPCAVIGIRVNGEKGLTGHIFQSDFAGNVVGKWPVLIADSLDDPNKLPSPTNVPWIAKLLQLAKWRLTWY